MAKIEPHFVGDLLQKNLHAKVAIYMPQKDFAGQINVRIAEPGYYVSEVITNSYTFALEDLTLERIISSTGYGMVSRGESCITRMNQRCFGFDSDTVAYQDYYYDSGLGWCSSTNDDVRISKRQFASSPDGKGVEAALDILGKTLEANPLIPGSIGEKISTAAARMGIRLTSSLVR
jgi:hypothetical protein